jgi:hypothetical protein
MAPPEGPGRPPRHRLSMGEAGPPAKRESFGVKLPYPQGPPTKSSPAQPAGDRRKRSRATALPRVRKVGPVLQEGRSTSKRRESDLQAACEETQRGAEPLGATGRRVRRAWGARECQHEWATRFLIPRARQRF